MALRLTRCIFVTILALFVIASDHLSGQQPKDLPNQITAEAVRRAKQATVYLKVTTEGGQTAEGSGFLALEPGIVITNAHVLGMLRANSKPPTSVAVVLHSGEVNEMQLTAKVLGVDRASDLAVLRVEGKLPAPLQFSSNDELFETQKVYIFGFPFGKELGKNITVSESSVSSLRKDARGTLERIQVNGGMHPGNSGGPVVNSLGHVVGIAVSGIRATQINFAIPARTVNSLLDGRIQDVKSGELFRQKTEVRVPLHYSCLDPLQRIREIRVEVWAGKPATNRSFSPKQPQPQAGDGPRQSHAIKYGNATASADVLLPPLAEGQVAWVQPVLVFAKGPSQWAPPQAFDPALAVERMPSNLTVRLTDQKERTVHLKTTQSMTLTKGKSKFVASETAELDILESFGSDPKGALVRTGFSLPDLTYEVDAKKGKASPQVASMLQQVPPSFVIDETNKLRSRVNINLNPKLSRVVREQVSDHLTHICNSYEAANLILPNRQMQPRGSWPAELPMLLKTGAKTELVDLVMTCTYEGMRSRSGNPEALVSFDGRVKGRNTLRDKVDGQVAGKFTFDAKRGFISSVTMVISSDASDPTGEIHALCALAVDLTRVEGNPRKIELPKGRSTPPVVATTPNPKGVETTSTRLFTKPAQSKTPTSYMKVVSSPGDFIGQGKTYDYRGDQLVIKRTARGVRITVDGWMADIGAPRGQSLTVREYPDAKRFAFSDDSPGLDFRGKGRGSNKLNGEFVVWELETKGDEIVHLAIDFIQRSNGKAPLHGKIRFQSAFE
jgi:S1-C subfamily serine protease